MINQLLQRLEDPQKPFFGPNYWFLQKIGLITPKSYIAQFIYLLIHETIVLFVITQYMELYIIRSDLFLVFKNLQISMLSVVCIVKSNTFIFWQKRWEEIINYVTVADNYERNDNDPVRQSILDKYTRYCRRVTYSYWFLLFFTFATAMASPYVHYLSSSSYRDDLRNGTELFPHILSSWVPFDKYHSPGCWITVAWHFTISGYGILIMAAYDSTIMVIMVFFGGKLDMLRERCKQMLGTGGVPISDEEAAANIKEIHGMHIDIIKYSNLFNSMLSPVMFLYIVLCALMLCATGYQLTSITNTMDKLFLGEYLVFGVTQLFIFCWHSNDVLEKFENAMLGPYESQWWAASIKQRKNILLLAGQMKICKVFSAGPFTDLTLYTFTTILKAAYSYYTLLRD